MDLVAKVALDSAQVANRSARAASHAASKLADLSASFDRTMARERRQTILIVSLCGLIALLAFAMFIASAVQLRGRVVQVNAMLNVMAARTIELRQGLEQLGPIAERVEGFSAEVAAMARAQRDTQAAIQRLDKALAARPVAVAPVAAALPVPAQPPPVPAVAPAQVAAAAPQRAGAPIVEPPDQTAARDRLLRQTFDSVQSLAAQTKALEASLRAQAGTLATLGTRVNAIEQSAAALPAMQSDLKLILKTDQARAAVVDRVTAERRREEALREERERFVQFQRPDASAAPGPTIAPR
jgi:prefoldin subunit 5